MPPIFPRSRPTLPTTNILGLRPTCIPPKPPQCARLASTTSPAQKVTWQQYFELRKSRKNWERAGGVIGGVGGFLGGAYYFGAVADFDPTQQVLGMQDPTFLYILGAIAVAGGASAGGILLSGQAWRLLKSREVTQALDRYDKEFFHRIQRHRPKEIAAASPIPGQQGGMPDYYGEKIYSVADYRSWLRKQRKFHLHHKTRFGGSAQL
ncbi:TIM23 complex component [Rhizophlyctis rosea]|nr:TIM23 complex component [Rhizophlyctis rosea]